MNLFATIDIGAPHWNGPFLRACYMGKGRTDRNYPTDDLTRSAMSSGGGWNYVLEGRFQVKEDQTVTWVEQGESFLFTNPTHAALVYPEPVSRLTVALYGEDSAKILEQLIRRYGSFHKIPATSAVVKMATRLFRLAKQQPIRDAHAWSILFYEWLIRLCQALEIPETILDSRHQVIRNSRLLGSVHPNFKSYAQAMGYNAAYLARTIKKSWDNKSPAKLLRLGRLSEAEMLLRTTNMSIREIAEKACYSSPESFATAFGSVYGLPPLKYRHSSRAGWL